MIDEDETRDAPGEIELSVTLTHYPKPPMLLQQAIGSVTAEGDDGPINIMVGRSGGAIVITMREEGADPVCYSMPFAQLTEAVLDHYQTALDREELGQEAG